MQFGSLETKTQAHKKGKDVVPQSSLVIVSETQKKYLDQDKSERIREDASEQAYEHHH